MNELDDAMDDGDTIPVKAGKKGLRWLLAEIHLWLGLILCVPLVLLGLSGSYLMYHDEIDQVFSGAPPFEVSNGPMQHASEIAAAAAAAAPAGFSVRMLSMPDAVGEPATARIAPEGAGFRDPRVKTVAIDPSTLAVLGDVGGGRSMLTGIMHDIHGHALISGGAGRQIIGWLGAVMLFLGITGLVIWWPRPRRLWAALTIKRGARGLRLHRDLHGAIGFWTLSVFVVVCFTGVYIAFPKAISTAMQMVLADTVANDRGAPVKPVAGVSEMGLDAAIKLAEEAVPDAHLVMAMMPFRPGQPLRVRFKVPGASTGAPMLSVMIDPWKRAITKIEDPRIYGRTETAMAWQRPLHEGMGLGPVWRGLVFVSGFLPLLFSITGVSMWLLKRRAKAKRARGKA